MKPDTLDNEWAKARADQQGGQFVSRCCAALVVVLIALVAGLPSCAVLAQTAPVTGEADLSEVYAELEAIKARLDALEADSAEPEPQPITDPVTPGPDTPTEPPTDADEHGEGFTELDLTDAVKLPANATREQVQAALDGDKPVALAAGSVIDGWLVLPDAVEVLAVHGDGPRPVLNVPPGQHGIDLTNDWIESVTIQGIEVRGPPELGDRKGIRLRINARDGKYAKAVLIEDCKIVGFDSNIEIVDSWSRAKTRELVEQGIEDPLVPGRINLVVRRCILGYSAGTDTHHVGMQLEGLERGLVEQTIIDHSGWAPGRPEMRDEKSHGIYAQGIGGPTTVRGCVFTRSAATGAQLRSGGDFIDNIVSECAVGMYPSRTPSVVRNNVVLDQVDIRPDVQADWRGRGIEGFRLPEALFERNLLARRGGSKDHPAIKVYGANTTVRGNVAVDWADPGSPNITLDDRDLEGIDGNRTVNGAEVPAFTEELREHRMNRPRGVWGASYETRGFIDACWEAIAE